MVETARRREIEDVASSLFRERGYAGTSVRDIARAMDIQGASLYAHVASKQDVLRTIVERMASRFEHAADEASRSIDGGEMSTPPARLAALVRAHVQVVTDDLERATVFVHEWRSLDPDARTRMAKRRDAYERRFRIVIAAGVADGTFAATWTPMKAELAGAPVFIVHVSCAEAVAALTLGRLRVADFKPKRSQRRALAQHGNLVPREMNLGFREDHYQLYQPYQAARHSGGGASLKM